MKAVTRRIRVVGMAATANKNMGVSITGIDPEAEKSVFALNQKVDTITGDFFAQDKRNQIVISRALATELKAKVKELEKRLERFGELSETLSEMGLMPR